MFHRSGSLQSVNIELSISAQQSHAYLTRPQSEPLRVAIIAAPLSREEVPMRNNQISFYRLTHPDNYVAFASASGPEVAWAVLRQMCADHGQFDRLYVLCNGDSNGGMMFAKQSISPGQFFEGCTQYVRRQPEDDVVYFFGVHCYAHEAYNDQDTRKSQSSLYFHSNVATGRLSSCY